jgi:hypothetical protein
VIKDRLQGDAGVPSPDPPAPAPAPDPTPVEPPAPASPTPPQPAPPQPRPVPDPVPAAPTRHALDSGPTAVSLTREELAGACGLHERVLGELERYGLITGRPMGRDTLYDEEALVVARLAAGFMRFGVEARHLRMYKVSAEREASFFEQVVLPLVKQRNPDARRQAVTNLGELTDLGESLRAAMLRQALKTYTGG